MCTLSWLREEDGYALWFNRDELRTRALERAPTLHETPTGLAWLAPEDPDSDGTWLMVNAHGLSCALLNRYVPDVTFAPVGERPSRGRLVPLAAGAETAEEAVEKVRGESLAGTPGFHLVAIDAAGGVAELRWDGKAGHLAAGDAVVSPVTSSSQREAEIEALRRLAYPAEPTVESLADYHHAHDTADGAASVNMCRADACTRSICHVRVGPEWVALDYEPQGWLGQPPASPTHHRLTRRRPVSLAPGGGSIPFSPRHTP
jgi:hypothetical protein